MCYPAIYRKPDFSFHPCDYAGYLPGYDAHPIYPNVRGDFLLVNALRDLWMANLPADGGQPVAGQIVDGVQLRERLAAAIRPEDPFPHAPCLS